MIEKLFATHVLIKDIGLTDTENEELNVLVKSLLKKYETEILLDSYHGVDDAIPLFTEENLKNHPLLKKIKDCFVDGFYELAQSYENNEYSKETIESIVAEYTGKIPVMKNGESRGIHNHPGAVAFGILYLNDIDNDKDGGELVLYDPAWSNLIGFTNEQQYKVETRKNRLVIAPAHVWHSVARYIGNDERIAIVFNLDLIPAEKIANLLEKK